jgi:hypothetical protein
VRRINRRQLLQRGALAAGALATSRTGIAVAEPRGHWLAGDFHSHTVLSHDVWGGPGDANTGIEDAYTFGFTTAEQIANAEARRLDFLAITDHNLVDAAHSAEYRSGRLTLVPGYEHSLAGGHSGVFVPDRESLREIVKDTDGSTAFGGDDGARRFLDLVHARGGIAVLNHPFYGNRDQGEALAWGYGPEVSADFDAVEVWNIGWPARHDTIPFADSDNYLSLPWWEKEVLSRRQVAAVGGSDSHWRASSGLNGVGQPTTWVYARGRTPAAVLRAVREGRTFIAAEPPALGGSRLFLEAREAWRGGRRAMVGDTVRANGPLKVKVVVENGGGSRLRLVANGEQLADTLVLGHYRRLAFELVLPDPAELRAELYVDRGYFMTALTSPIYASGKAPARHRAGPHSGPAVTYGHPSKHRGAPSEQVMLRRRAGCGC